MRATTKYTQVYDGDTIEVIGRHHKISCCDCGLVHLLKFRMRGSVITFKAFRDNRATAQRRRKRKAQEGSK